MANDKKPKTIVIGPDETKLMVAVIMMAGAKMEGPDIAKRLMDGFGVSAEVACEIIVVTVETIETAYPGLQSIKEKAVNSGGKKENKA